MYDINDPEVVETMKYLEVTKAERIQLQAKPFDAKTSCWIPDAKEGYLSASIIATKGDDITVHTEKQEVGI